MACIIHAFPSQKTGAKSFLLYKLGQIYATHKTAGREKNLAAKDARRIILSGFNQRAGLCIKNEYFAHKFHGLPAMPPTYT
ncbi:MAG: hypothetical protein LUD72_03410, partial [Bacteroidales bacterium]|nr:hypothetical protein [Bacteroidales bacterium]